MNSIDDSFFYNNHKKMAYIRGETFPIPKSYKDCIMPKNHPWYKTAQIEIKNLIEAIGKKTVSKEFIILGCPPDKTFFDITDIIVTKNELPFVIKMNISLYPEKNDTIIRVLLSERARAFIQHEHLDRLYVPKKYLLPKNMQNPPPEINSRNYVVVAEKLEITKRSYKIPPPLLQLEEKEAFSKKIWKQLDPSTRYCQKMQVGYLCIILCYTDPHDGNVVLLKNGLFGILDFDEPHYKNLYLELLNLSPHQSLVHHQNQIELAKKSLKLFFLDYKRQIKLGREDNRTLYNKCLRTLRFEKKTNRALIVCQQILLDRPSHYGKQRKENLQERVFFILRT